MSEHEFWLAIRQALAMAMDAIERRFLPAVMRTSVARKLAKQAAQQPEKEC